MVSLEYQEAGSSERFEPIAIVGMGCRWPGDSETPSELWEFLQTKRNAYSKFPSDRINTEAFYHPNSNRPGSFYTEGGAFLRSNVRDFDHTFFGIHPREVMSIDPAQRKFLEVVYEAFENGGVPLHRLAGTKTGCFVGNFNYDHQLMQYRDAEYPGPYSVTGGGITMLSNRVNYIFDLKGPSMTLDTACSSSMYALHLACSSIQTGECTAAVVGGTNLILTPECQIFSSSLGAVSPTSVCHTFDASADGYARADGIGALFIKKLSEAVRDGDPIRAVIRGTAINANGRTGGITHPSPDGQEAVIRRAYERAGGLDPSLTGYFECHGTGTAAGDPLEIAAIGRVFAPTRSSSTPLLLGSIKSNMGHSEPTSGIAGIMKAVLAIEHGIIPPTIGLETLNPNIDLKDGKLSIVTEGAKWPDLPVRRASINSFGYGGANAHVIIESADSVIPGYRSSRQEQASESTMDHSQHGASAFVPDPRHLNAAMLTNGRGNKYFQGRIDQGADHHTASTTRHRFLLPFSAHEQKTLKNNIAALRATGSNWALADIAYTLSVRRSVFSHRTFTVAECGDLSANLDPEKMTVTKKQGSSAPAIAYVFTGQGAQWPQMGLKLIHELPSYLKTIRALDKHLDSFNDGRTWSLEDVLRDANPQRIHDAELAQPLVTATQIALVKVLAEWNVLPAAVVGHSSGEIAASYAAGLTTEKSAIVAAYLRGKAMARNTQKGSMMAISMTAAAVESFLAPLDNKVVVACHNAPESLTLSGDSDVIAEVKKILDKENKFARLLKTGGNAYHSPHMELLGQQYEDELSEFERSDSGGIKSRVGDRETSTAFYSSVYGRRLSGSPLGPTYWKANLQSPVLFYQAVVEMVKSSRPDIMIEIGPHAALQGPLRQVSKMSNLQDTFPEYLASMVRNNDNMTDLLTLSGKLFTNGYGIDLGRVNAIQSKEGAYMERSKVVVDLPHYQWQYPEQALLLENRYTREWRLRTHARHDILGSRIPGGVPKEPVWRNILRNKDVAWLTDHRLAREIVFPSTGYLSMALEAATQVIELGGINAMDIKNYELRNVSLTNPLIVPEDDYGVETLFTMRHVSLNASTRYDSRFEFTLTSVINKDGKDTFVEHCRGTIDVNVEDNDEQKSSLVTEIEAATPFKKDISASTWYEKFAEVGLCYGPIFQGLSNIKAAGATKLTEAKVKLNPTAKIIQYESRYVIHPAALDAAMQLSILSAHSSSASKFKRAFMPVAFETIKIWPGAIDISNETVRSIANGSLKGVRGLSADMVLLGARQKAILSAKNIFLIASDQNAQELSRTCNPYTRMVWKPEFEGFSDSTIAALYPPVVLEAGAIIPSLNELALFQLIHFRATNPQIFEIGSKVPHLQRMLEWIDSKLKLAQADRTSAAQTILDCSDAYRAEKIAKLEANLSPISSEARLMNHLYHNLPDIYAGEKTGIQVALQDNLLIENYESGQAYKEGNKRLGKVIALLAHQKPGLRILEIGAGTGSASREVLLALQGNTRWRRYMEYRFTDTTTSFLAGAEEKFCDFNGVTYGAFDMEKSAVAQGYLPEWDVIIASNVIHATSNIKGTLLNIRSALKPAGKMVLLEITQPQLSAGLVLGTFSDFWKGDYDEDYPRFDGPFLSKSLWRNVLPQAGFRGLDFYLDDYAGKNVSATVFCASAVEAGLIPTATSLSPTTGLTLIYRGVPTPFVLQVADYLKSDGTTVDMFSIESSDDIRYDRLLFLVEIDRPFFLDTGAGEWNGLQICLKLARSALWVTRGGLMHGREPLFAMISGLARGLKTEINHLRFSVLDLDEGLNALSSSEVYDLLARFERRTANPSHDDDDTEFRRKDGLTYISRLVADHPLNEKSKAQMGQQTSTVSTLLRDLRSTPVRLDIDKPGVLSTLYFREDDDFASALAADHVEIEVRSAGVNNRDIAVVTGRHHSDTFSDECAGTVTRVGTAVKEFKPGDRVYCQSFAKFGNFVRDKASFCQKFGPEDTFEEMATLPMAFCTTIYGLINLGRLNKQESVLIQSATGAIGLAAVQIALMCEAEIYATVGTPEKKAALLSMGFGIKEDHILPSRDAFSATALLELTNGKGVDVILCSARGQLMHDYWRCIATSGRFIEIGQTEILDRGTLSLDVFRRNAMFASFDLEVMSKEQPHVIGELMSRVQELRIQGLIKPLPHTTFHISDIDGAFMSFAKGSHIGKIVLSYDHEKELGIKLRQTPFSVDLDPDAAYLLVGCLGGLGRSFSKWAVQRGARSLIYLAPTGASKPEAQHFLQKLRLQGVDIKVITGNVASLQDVKTAIAASSKPIKGVVQGALTLNDGLFESMTLEKFNSTIGPRVMGTLNLHEALKDAPLDFFQMWSSWTVMFGTATQSNYLASNAFMDAFARHRSSLGMPATSLALSQILGIGIVSYMPEYQHAMVRNGFYGNDEDDFLRFCETGIQPPLSPPPPPPTTTTTTAAAATAPDTALDPHAAAHLLAGIEPAGLADVDRKYPVGEMVWSRDPRFSNLLQATRFWTSAAGGGDGGREDGASGPDEEVPVEQRIRLKVSRLLYVPAEDVDAATAVSAYGIDSMIAAELRNWLFATFGLDVSLLNLLGPTMTVRRLADDAVGLGV